jgi:hypothetical protein
MSISAVIGVVALAILQGGLVALPRGDAFTRLARLRSPGMGGGAARDNRGGHAPALQGPQGRAEVDQLRSDVESRLHGIESAASSVAGGNLGAIATLFGYLRNAPSTEGRIVGQVRDTASELGVSLASSPSCRQLVGLKL